MWRGLERSMKVTDTIKEDLNWWIENTHTASRKVQKPLPTHHVYSDSSNFAWGGVFKGQSTGGPWIGSEIEWHINEKELQAAFFTLKAFCSLFRNVHIRLHMDNTTAIAYVNGQGGKKHFLNRIAREIWLWAQERLIWLSAEHIPGVQNVLADEASRSKYQTETEWHLKPSIFSNLQDIWGPLEVDLFASRLNYQCTNYFAWKPDPGAQAIDAFAQKWSDLKGFVFPPFSLIGRCIQKLIKEQAELVFVTPLWPSQPWFAQLLHLTIDHPRILPLAPDLLTLPQDQTAVHPLWRRLHLTAWPLSGKPSKPQDFQTKLPSWSWGPGEVQLKNNIGSIGPNGSCFVVNGKCLLCKHLCRWILKK